MLQWVDPITNTRKSKSAGTTKEAEAPPAKPRKKAGVKW
jgi:hypothetical protein